MKSFEDAIDFVLRWEGGYVNDPNDHGGETYRGISRKSHPDWAGWPVVDAHVLSHGDIISALEPHVWKFYRENYWDKIKGDQLPSRVAIAVMDWAVHSSVERASRALQNIVGASPDGIIGPITVKSVYDYMDKGLSFEIVEERREFLARLVSKRPSDRKFSEGWDNRLDSLSSVIA